MKSTITLITCVFLCLACQTGSVAASQLKNTPGQFTPISNKDFPEIRIYVSQGEYKELEATKGKKLVLSTPVMIINEDTAHIKEIHVRGNNSLKFKRKSLSVELSKSINIEMGHKKTHLKKFNLLNLSMDKHVWHNRWSDLTMESLGMFPLINSYCTVWINDQPQGIFLLIEKPQHAKAKLSSPYMLRRGPEHTITDEYFEESEKKESKKYRNQFQSMYYSYSSEDEQARQLDKIINLENYFQFIGFNYLVMNGDYADEVFFYIEPTHQWFEVIPWDYDDILRPIPHEGRTERNKEFADKKIFSLEESLDRIIAGNKVLYNRYEQTLKKLLNTLDSAKLTQYTHQVINELEQISADKSTSEATLFLDSTPFNITLAKEDILYSLDFVLKRRKWILAELK